jgi:hypothetical protein
MITGPPPKIYEVRDILFRNWEAFFATARGPDRPWSPLFVAGRRVGSDVFVGKWTPEIEMREVVDEG